MKEIQWAVPSTSANPTGSRQPYQSASGRVNAARGSSNISDHFLDHNRNPSLHSPLPLSTPSVPITWHLMNTPNTLPIDPTTNSFKSPGKRRRASTGASTRYDSILENLPSSPSLRPAAKRPKPRRDPTSPSRNSKAHNTAKRASPRTTVQKIESVLSCIKQQHWSFGECLHQLFRLTNDDGTPCSRSPVHAQMVSLFLGGTSTHSVGQIIECWMASADGRLPVDSYLQDLMFSTTVPYEDMKHVRPALTSFAVQTIRKKVAREAESAINSSSGLHAHPSSKVQTKVFQWTDAGEDTVPYVGGVLKEHQPVTFWLFEAIASRRPRKREGVVVATRKRRPAEGTIIHALASLDFCRSDRANLLPLSRGLLYFGTSAPVELIAYNSRIGNTPSYSTIYKAYEGLSQLEAIRTKAHGRDPSRYGFMIIDNVQNYARVRDNMIGRVTKMNVGIAGIYIEGEGAGVHVDDFDLKNRRALIALDKRRTVTVDVLLGFIDQDDADIYGTLLWIECLARCTGSKALLADVRLRMKASAKLKMPLHKSVIHPLACSSKKETIPTELKAALLDFFEQIGQTPELYNCHKVGVGGDGLTYAMLLQLQQFLQFTPDPFKSFEIMEPQLQVWHTKWTDLSRIYQTHWGRTTGKPTNPSTLGHSAQRIGRAKPSNLSKVEFYSGSETLFTVLDARMLDCWSLILKTDDIFAYFEDKALSGSLPDVQTLLPLAQSLHHSYSTARGRDAAAWDAVDGCVPCGAPWTPVPVEVSSLDDQAKKKRTGNTTAKEKGDKAEKAAKARAKKAAKANKDAEDRRGPGDQVLAQSIDFFRDALNSRKIAYCVADGSVGRVYECIKYMLFTFAGSTHTNYMNYLLETILTLELESSPGLRDSLLRCLLLNLLGYEDMYAEGDFVMEFFNRLLEMVVERKTAEFDDNFIRNVLARNLRQIAALKVAWRVGAGMDPKSSKHSQVHKRAEMRILLALYRDVQLHQYRIGRIIDDRDTDDFAKGVNKLRGPTLARIIGHSERMRGMGSTANQQSGQAEEEGDEDSSSVDNDDHEDPTHPPHRATMGSMFFVDGELIIDSRDMLCDPPESERTGRDGDEEESEESILMFDAGWDQSDDEDL